MPQHTPHRLNPQLDWIVTQVASCLCSSAQDSDRVRLTTGDLADLRRANMSSPPAAFWKIFQRYDLDSFGNSDTDQQAWMLLMQGMVLAGVQHISPHKTHTLGRALAESGYAAEDRPLRLNRLLLQTGPGFHTSFCSMARFLASKSTSVYWATAAPLVFTAHQPATDPARTAARRGLAQDFYRHLLRPTST